MKTLKLLLSGLLLLSITIFSACNDDEVPPTPTPELSNSEKAIAVLQGVASGDVTALQDYISSTEYIQHNLDYPSGAAAFIGAVQSGAFTGTTVETVRSFTHDNIVVLHSEYAGTWNLNTPQAVLDVFRFENGLIVEHWDNLVNISSDGDATTQLNGVLTPATDLGQTEANKILILELAQNFFLDGGYSKLPNYFNVDNFTQHSVGFGTDITGLQGYVNSLPAGSPFYSSVEFIHVEGNFALMMSQGFPDATTGLASAYYDMFRIEDGKIVEHWDVVQQIPAEADWQNTNGKWGTNGLNLTPTPPTNAEKAIAVLQAIQSGDVTAMQDYLNQTTYTQHNLSYPDGAATLIGAVQAGAFTGTTIETVRAFTDGDIVVLHSKYGGTWNSDTAQAVFDVFRFENDLIVEHWDNLVNVSDDGDETTQFNGPTTPATDLDKTEANRTVMENMTQKIFRDGLYSTLGTYFDEAIFTQHSVGYGTDISGLQNFFVNVLGEGTPFYASIKFIHVEGNFALSMSQGFPDATTGLSTAFYDLFRLENGKIVEHWDVVQGIPAESDWANSNGKW